MFDHDYCCAFTYLCWYLDGEIIYGKSLKVAGSWLLGHNGPKKWGPILTSPYAAMVIGSNTIRYDTIEEINVDSKAEYTA